MTVAADAQAALTALDHGRSVVVAGADGTGGWAAVADRLLHGGRLIVTATAETALAEFSEAVSVGVEIAAGGTHPRWPHVAGGVTYTGTGRLAGITGTIETAHTLNCHLAGNVAAMIAREVVAVDMPWGTGRLVVTPDVFHAAAVADPANAALACWALDLPHEQRLDSWKASSVAHVSTPGSVSANDWHVSVEGLDGSINDRQFLRAARAASRQLPEDVVNAVLDFAEDGGVGALLIRGFEYGPIPATPATPTTPAEKSRSSELTLLAVARLLGHAVGYQPEHGGDIVQNILPTPTGAYRQVSTSSKVQLMFHTEAAFHPHQPRWLLLACLRGDENAHTTYASIRDVVDLLPLSVRRTLAKPMFRCGVDESYGSTDQLSDPRPVLWGSFEEPRLWFDAELVSCDEPEGNAALEVLRAAVRECEGKVTLREGDLLVIDNTLVVHGRSPFTPRFDGTDRWLQRSFVVADLAPSDADREGRIITTRFAR